MKAKFSSMMDTTVKKKAGVALLCGALFATIAAGTALAAELKSPLLTKTDNGVRTYSTDGGKTWGTNYDGAETIETKDGKPTVANVLPAGGANAKGLLIKHEDGVTLYSADGGKTWSKTAPAGFDAGGSGPATYKQENGTSSIQRTSEDTNGDGLLSKVENGVRTYSTDGGKTWSEEAPEGLTVIDSGDGKVTFSENGLPPQGEAETLAIKIENGVTLYSTDDGSTWSENAPEGLKTDENGTMFQAKKSK
ncbi:sialidase family protein [Paenibacillus hamazuiensis]|uniref:sialidase family protein n=1 Tax=Paenibacillus hamazuiensis TaxID=2936508 RepID=UPI00200E368F|nr:sialidase family protein [Paenibacillus hamazuiensis]